MADFCLRVISSLSLVDKSEKQSARQRDLTLPGGPLRFMFFCVTCRQRELTFLFLYILQDVEQMIPHHLNGGNEQTLVGGVDATKGGAERHHVEVGITL